MSHLFELCAFCVFPFHNLIFFTPWLLKIEILQFSNTSTVVYIVGSLFSYNFSFVIIVSKKRPVSVWISSFQFIFKRPILYNSSIANKVIFISIGYLTLFWQFLLINSTFHILNILKKLKERDTTFVFSNH